MMETAVGLEEPQVAGKEDPFVSALMTGKEPLFREIGPSPVPQCQVSALDSYFPDLITPKTTTTVIQKK
jgi:hypothetical protein